MYRELLLSKYPELLLNYMNLKDFPTLTEEEAVDVFEELVEWSLIQDDDIDEIRKELGE